MNPAAFFGWSAAGFMLLTFSCQDARWLRSLAICANVAFIAYGLVARLHPVAVLHLISLPINVYRLCRAMRAFELGRTSAWSPTVKRERIDRPQDLPTDCTGMSMMNPPFFDDIGDNDKPSRRSRRRGNPRFPRRHSTRHLRLRQL